MRHPGRHGGRALGAGLGEQGTEATEGMRASMATMATPTQHGDAEDNDHGDADSAPPPSIREFHPPIYSPTTPILSIYAEILLLAAGTQP